MQLLKLAAVDVFDQKIRKYSCQRITNRWTHNTGMYIVDASASNAIVLHKLKFQEYEKNKNRARRFCLETLALELIQPCIKWRIEMRQRNNFVGVQKDILNAIIKTGESINSMIRPTANQSKLDKQKRCGI